MKNYKLPLIMAGTLMLLSAIMSQIFDKEVSMVLILGLTGLFVAMLAKTKYGRKLIACEINFLKGNPLKFMGISLCVVFVFGGIGYLLGKVLHQLAH